MYLNVIYITSLLPSLRLAYLIAVSWSDFQAVVDALLSNDLIFQRDTGDGSFEVGLVGDSKADGENAEVRACESRSDELIRHVFSNSTKQR